MKNIKNELPFLSMLEITLSLVSFKMLEIVYDFFLIAPLKTLEILKRYM